MNQLATMIPNFNQLMLEAPKTAKPEPIMAPMIVCVPEIGIPKTEEAMMNRNELMETPSIILLITVSLKVSTSSITSLMR